MESEQSVSERIIDVLREDYATNKDLSQVLDVGEESIRTTIYRMVKSGVIVHTGRFINRYKLYRLAIPEELEMHKNCETIKKILIKMILPFAKSGIKINLLPSEQKRINDLFQDNYSSSGRKKR